MRIFLSGAAPGGQPRRPVLARAGLFNKLRLWKRAMIFRFRWKYQIPAWISKLPLFTFLLIKKKAWLDKKNFNKISSVKGNSNNFLILAEGVVFAWFDTSALLTPLFCDKRIKNVNTRIKNEIIINRTNWASVWRRSGFSRIWDWAYNVSSNWFWLLWADWRTWLGRGICA